MRDSECRAPCSRARASGPAGVIGDRLSVPAPRHRGVGRSFHVERAAPSGDDAEPPWSHSPPPLVTVLGRGRSGRRGSASEGVGARRDASGELCGPCGAACEDAGAGGEREEGGRAWSPSAAPAAPSRNGEASVHCRPPSSPRPPAPRGAVERRCDRRGGDRISGTERIADRVGWGPESECEKGRADASAWIPEAWIDHRGDPECLRRTVGWAQPVSAGRCITRNAGSVRRRPAPNPQRCGHRCDVVTPSPEDASFHVEPTSERRGWERAAGEEVHQRTPPATIDLRVVPAPPGGPRPGAASATDTVDRCRRRPATRSGGCCVIGARTWSPPPASARDSSRPRTSGCGAVPLHPSVCSR